MFNSLMDHHDELKLSANRRIEWKILCVEFAKHGLADRTGKPPTAATARQTWWRVRKEKRRIEMLRARAEIERAVKLVNNPRRNMPSQWPKGEYGPPSAEAPPRQPAATAVTKKKAAGRWNQKYEVDEDGFIICFNGRSSAAQSLQVQNLRSGYPRDKGLETLIGEREE